MSGKITRIALWVLFFSFIAVGTAAAQTISLNVQDQPTGSATARIFNIILMITVLSIAPSILVMMTSFTRIIVVFSITRSALATNSTPPNMVLISLALFLTMFIMAPTFEKVWDEGIKPMYEEKLEITEGAGESRCADERIYGAQYAGEGFAAVYRSGKRKAGRID